MDRGIRTDERVNVWDADFWHLNEGDGSPLALLHSGHPFEDEVDVFLNSYQCQVGTGLSSGSIFATRVAQQTRMRMKKTWYLLGALGSAVSLRNFVVILETSTTWRCWITDPLFFWDAIMIHDTYVLCIYIYIVHCNIQSCFCFERHLISESSRFSSTMCTEAYDGDMALETTSNSSLNVSKCHLYPTFPQVFFCDL